MNLLSEQSIVTTILIRLIILIKEKRMSDIHMACHSGVSFSSVSVRFHFFSVLYHSKLISLGFGQLAGQNNTFETVTLDLKQ